MSKPHTERIMVLIDDVWHAAGVIDNSYDINGGGIQALLNGLVVPVKGGYWYNIDNRLTEDQIRNKTIQSNIDQLFQIAAQKASHKKIQERLAENQRRSAQAAELAAQQAANPQPEQPVVRLERDEDDFDDFMNDFNDGYCDCDDCRAARGEL